MRNSHFSLPRFPLLALALAATALITATFAPRASAGAYAVEVCTQSSQPDAFVVAGEPATEGLEGQNTCGVPGQPRLLLLAREGAATIRRNITATLRAPDDTFIEELKMIRSTGADWPSTDVVSEIGSATAVLNRIDGVRGAENLDLDVNSPEARVSLRCAAVNCDLGGKRPIVAMREIVATLVDFTPPRVQLPVLPELEASVKGTVSIPFRATDAGGGINGTFLFVDGAPVAAVPETNEGRCVVPYRFLVPCALAVDRSFLLDTTKLSKGPHDVQVRATDAGNLEGVSRIQRLTVDNTPPTAPPTNPPTGPGGNPGTRTPPRLSGVSLSRHIFKASKRALLRFTSSEAGTVTVTISRLPARARARAVLTRQVAAGPGSIPIPGRIGRKPLRPGPYRLAVSVRDADGDVSATSTLRLRIVKG